MAIDKAKIEEARKRRLKEPLHITGYAITMSKIVSADPNQPRTHSELVSKVVETVGDLASLDAQMKVGKFIPVPDLGLQALNIVIDKLGLLEGSKPDVAFAGAVAEVILAQSESEVDEDGA